MNLLRFVAGAFRGTCRIACPVQLYKQSDNRKDLTGDISTFCSIHIFGNNSKHVFMRLSNIFSLFKEGLIIINPINLQVGIPWDQALHTN